MNNGRMLSDMMVFAEVVSTQSYTLAASRLGLSKSAVSQQVKRLENNLGESLLTRNTRGMSLTSAGEVLSRRCELIRDQIDLAKKELAIAKDSPSGRFHVTCPFACEKDIVIPALNRLCIEFPQLQPMVMATDDVKDLIQDSLDVAIYTGPLKNSRYRAQIIGEMREQIYASKEYLIKYGHPKSLDDAAQHKWIMLPWQEKSLQLELHGEAASMQELDISASSRSNTLSGALEMVKAGMGIALLPTITANNYIRDGSLTQILSSTVGIPRMFYLIHRYPSIKTLHLQRFLELVQYYFRTAS